MPSQGTPLNETLLHCRVLCEHLRVRCHAQRDLGGAVRVSWHLHYYLNTSHVFS